ncbi:MAG: hypothetical protein PHD04_00850 [Candidatus Pacebacteria bacterium]|nr:hypothetical protein [Candidatus Paceibacterota bacterium]
MVKQWVDFEASHARYIIEHGARQQECWSNGDLSDEWCKSWGDKLIAYTLMVDGCPVACGGLVLQGWGRSEAWVLLSKSFKPYKVAIHRMVKTGLENAFLTKIVSRIQATIDAGCPEHIEWIEALGFEFEGRLRRFGPFGQDYLMYSLIYDDHQ